MISLLGRLRAHRRPRIQSPPQAEAKPTEACKKHEPLESLQIEQNDLVIFAEDGHFYLVPERAYQASPLPVSLWAAPEFVVGLGAVAADLQFFQWAANGKTYSLHELTKDVPCVVLNLASLFNDREKQGPRRSDGRPKVSRRPTEEIPPIMSAEEPKLDPRDVIIFDNKRDFYWVKYKEHLDPTRCAPLSDALTSAPMLAAGLGTVVADIPFLPTVGCSCVLLNLAFLKRGSHYAAQLLHAAMLRADAEAERLVKETEAAKIQRKERAESAVGARANSKSRSH